MNKHLIRIVALLLVLCLIADPSLAALGTSLPQTSPSIAQMYRFEQEALIGAVVRVQHFILREKKAPHHVIDLRQTVMTPAGMTMPSTYEFWCDVLNRLGIKNNSRLWLTGTEKAFIEIVISWLWEFPLRTFSPPVFWSRHSNWQGLGNAAFSRAGTRFISIQAAVKLEKRVSFAGRWRAVGTVLCESFFIGFLIGHVLPTWHATWLENPLSSLFKIPLWALELVVVSGFPQLVMNTINRAVLMPLFGINGAMTIDSPSFSKHIIPSQPRLLIAEDNADTREMTTKLLEQAGFAVEAAVDGTAAMHLFRPGKFSGVLTDGQMPGITGEELIREIKTHDSKLPIILMSADAEMISRVQTTYPDVHIARKPADPANLIVVLKRLMATPTSSLSPAATPEHGTAPADLKRNPAGAIPAVVQLLQELGTRSNYFPHDDDLVELTAPKLESTAFGPVLAVVYLGISSALTYWGHSTDWPMTLSYGITSLLFGLAHTTAYYWNDTHWVKSTEKTTLGTRLKIGATAAVIHLPYFVIAGWLAQLPSANSWVGALLVYTISWGLTATPSTLLHQGYNRRLAKRFGLPALTLSKEPGQPLSIGRLYPVDPLLRDLHHNAGEGAHDTLLGLRRMPNQARETTVRPGRRSANQAYLRYAA